MTIRLLRRVLRRALRRILRRRLPVGLNGGRVLRRVLRGGSKKGPSRRHLEGRNVPFREYEPLRVHPTQKRQLLFRDSRAGWGRGRGWSILTLESGGSLTRQELFTEWPFLQKCP